MKGINLQKIAPYLYYVTYSDWDYADGEKYFERFKPDLDLGACSSIRKGNFYGRKQHSN